MAIKHAFYVKNVPGWERLLRIVLSSAVVVYALSTLSAPWSLITAVSALVFAGRGVVGFCPMCALPWLTTVVRNMCHRLLHPFWRQRQRLGEAVDAETASAEAPDPESALERYRMVQTVHLAISQLDIAYREVLVLRDLEGMSGDDVCAALQISDSAMKSRLHRARQQVRAALLAAGLPR